MLNILKNIYKIKTYKSFKKTRQKLKKKNNIKKIFFKNK